MTNRALLSTRAVPNVEDLTISQLVLGIETSCDETAVACVSSEGDIRGQAIYSQLSAHAPYGGIVPEIAARAHLERLQPLIDETLRQAQVAPERLDAVAATAGPGLIGGVSSAPPWPRLWLMPGKSRSSPSIIWK